MIKISNCSISDAWYADHIGESFIAYRLVSVDDEPAYIVRASDGYSNIVLCKDCEEIDERGEK